GFHNHMYAAEVHYAVTLFDPLGVLARLKERLAEYPPALRRALVGKHLFEAEFWLAGCERSARRGDVLHVAGSGFPGGASPVPVVYAANDRWWTNEKQALADVRSLARVPAGFAGAVAGVLAHPGATPAALAATVDRVHRLAAEVRELAATFLAG